LADLEKEKSVLQLEYLQLKDDYESLKDEKLGLEKRSSDLQRE
jgi:hypothetical protein